MRYECGLGRAVRVELGLLLANIAVIVIGPQSASAQTSWPGPKFLNWPFR